MKITRTRVAMAKGKAVGATIPAGFDCLEEVASFCGSHDLAECEPQLEEVDLEVSLEQRSYLAVLEPDLSRRVAVFARSQGASAQTLVNLRLSERLVTATSGP